MNKKEFDGTIHNNFFKFHSVAWVRNNEYCKIKKFNLFDKQKVFKKNPQQLINSWNCDFHVFTRLKYESFRCASRSICDTFAS